MNKEKCIKDLTNISDDLKISIEILSNKPKEEVDYEIEFFGILTFVAAKAFKKLCKTRKEKIIGIFKLIPKMYQ